MNERASGDQITGCFLLYNKLVVSYKVKNTPRGCDHRTEEGCTSNPAVTRKVGKPTLFRLKIREGRRLIMEQVHYELQGQSLIVYVTKELDHHAVIDLRATSDKLIQAGNVKHIIFDFSDVDFMDSSGIGLIMGRHKKVMFLGGKTAVTGVGKNIDRIFRMSGLYQIVEKYVTPQEAVENL